MRTLPVVVLNPRFQSLWHNRSSSRAYYDHRSPSPFLPPSVSACAFTLTPTTSTPRRPANTVQFNTDVDARADGRRKRRKSWPKALVDDSSTDLSNDTDTESHDAVARPYLSNVSSISSSLLITTFFHLCRCKMFRPKMCCTHIKESTGKQCRKMYRDLCNQKRCVPTPQPRAFLF
jgi:hypothetical protein